MKRIILRRTTLELFSPSLCAVYNIFPSKERQVDVNKGENMHFKSHTSGFLIFISFGTLIAICTFEAHIMRYTHTPICECIKCKTNMLCENDVLVPIT